VSPSDYEFSSDWINIVSHMKYVKTLFLDFTEIVRKASPNGAADYSQGIHPLVSEAVYDCHSPNGAAEKLFEDKPAGRLQTSGAGGQGLFSLSSKIHLHLMKSVLFF